MRRLVESTFDHHEAHRAFIRLVAIENIHHAQHLKASETIRAINEGALGGLARILARGQASGAFRTDVAPVDVHMMISSLCFFRVANRATFGVIFDIDLLDYGVSARHRGMIGEAIIRFLAPA